jgi:polyketide cyclase/dehydrase/lipid transport protein
MSTPIHTSATVEGRGTVRAPAERVYELIANYRTGHQRIIPPKYFQNLRVEHGGRGAGTVITYDLKLLGKVRHARARVTEPDPGRVLVETVDEQNIVTTFKVDPVGASASEVTISTAFPPRRGLAGALERVFVRALLAPVYREELALLDSVASAGGSA